MWYSSSYDVELLIMRSMLDIEWILAAGIIRVHTTVKDL